MVGIKFEVENVIFFYCLKYVEIWEQFLTILLIFAVTIAKMLQKNGMIILQFYKVIVYHSILKSEAFQNNKAVIFSDLSSFSLQN